MGGTLGVMKMKKLLLGVTLTALLPLAAHAVEDGERTYACWKLFATSTGSIMALRASIDAHDQAEAISLCEIAFYPDTVEPLLREKQSRLKSEDGVTVVRRTVYIPEYAEPTAIAHTNRN